MESDKDAVIATPPQDAPADAAAASATAVASVAAPSTTAATEFVNPNYSIDVLHTIKTAQVQHGLRHADHQRYRQYCSRRLRRIRQSLHYTHGKGRYAKRKIDPKTVNDPRYLLIPLYSAERAWSYAMERKEENDAENPRAKFAVGGRLKKSVYWAQELQTLCQELADDKTKLEAEAYSSWVKGNFLQHYQQWVEAKSCYLLARKIYDQLGVVGHTEQQEEFKQRVREIDPFIRLCNYKLNIDGESAEATLSELRGDSHNAASALLQAQLDKVMADVRQKSSETLREITWGGKSVPIKADKVREHILAAQDQLHEIARTVNAEAKIPLYDHLLYCYTEAANAIRDDLRAQQAKQFAEKKNIKQEAFEEAQKPLIAYVAYQKVSRTIERDLLLAHSLGSQLDPLSKADPSSNETAGESETESVSQRTRTPKAKEVIKLYDVVLQNLEELQRLRAGDEEFGKECAALQLGLISFRAYFAGLLYMQSSKWHEAMAVLERAEQHVETAIDHAKALPTPVPSFLRIPPNETPLPAALARLRSQIGAKSSAAHAQALLAARPAQPSAPTGTTSTVALADVLDSYEAGSRAVQEGRLVDFPPSLIPVAAKPILFDLALDALAFPDLEQRKKAKSFFRFW